jgi:hypothetical protein
MLWAPVTARVSGQRAGRLASGNCCWVAVRFSLYSLPAGWTGAIRVVARLRTPSGYTILTLIVAISDVPILRLEEGPGCKLGPAQLPPRHAIPAAPRNAVEQRRPGGNSELPQPDRSDTGLFCAPHAAAATTAVVQAIAFVIAGRICSARVRMALSEVQGEKPSGRALCAERTRLLEPTDRWRNN